MKASLRRWIGIVLVVTSIISFITIITNLDLSTTAGFRAFITLSFGFASSCLLLSSVWLIQNGNLYTSWPSLSRLGLDVPPDPRTRGSSDESADIYEVYSVSYKSDKPPEYKDALKNSKPIDWFQSMESCSDQYPTQSCGARSYHKQQDLEDICDCGKADMCSSNTHFRNGLLSNSSMTQIAISMIRGFSHHATEPPNAIQCEVEPQPHDSSRISFYELDVGQLPLSNSPPKYSYLQSAGLIREESVSVGINDKAEMSDG